MFGKRKQDRKHRFAEEGLDELQDDEARPEPEDPELAEALMQLGLNRHAPLADPRRDKEAELGAEGGPRHPSAIDPWSASGMPGPVDAPDEPGEVTDSDAPSDSVESHEPPGEEEVPDATADADDPPERGRFVVPTAAMLAEPEVVESDSSSMADQATYAAMRRERARAAEQEAALRKAQDEAQELRAQLRQLQAATKTSETADARATAARVDGLEESLRASQERVDELTAELETVRSASRDVEAAGESVLELQSKVSALTTELEQSRSDAAAARDALERSGREAGARDGAVVAAEKRAEQLAAEVEELRAAAAKAPHRGGRSRGDVDWEKTVRDAVDQAQASQAQVEAVLADNRRLASDLAANLKSQEGLLFALTGLQTEVSEQRAWFESQIANLGNADSQQTSVIEALQAALNERDVELQELRLQLLETEAKRAEEAAAFVAALERQ